MDQNVNAAARHAATQEDAAEHAHRMRMLAIYLRLEAIENEKYKLTDEAINLRAEIVNTLDVKVGDVLERRDGLRLLVQRVEGRFEYLPGLPDEPLRFSAVVKCWCSPETKTGFHPRKHVWHTEWDDDAITCPQADEQHRHV